MKIIINANKRGIALVVVICISAVLLVFGLSYLQTVKETPATSGVQIRRVQSEFFARGIHNIALFKIKRYPDFFYRSYKIEMHQRRLERGDSTVSSFLFPNPAKPFSKYFVNDGGNYGLGGPLCNYHKTKSELSDFSAPADIASYSTSIKLVASNDFKSSLVEITVFVQHGISDVVLPYKVCVDMKQIALR